MCLATVLNLSFLNYSHAQFFASDDLRLVTLYLMDGQQRKVEKTDRLRARMQKQFFFMDFDGNGISDSDRELNRETNIASNVASRIREIMANDLNLDGYVTSAEIRLANLRNARHIVGLRGNSLKTEDILAEKALYELVEAFTERDLNGDGTISFDEAVREAKKFIIDYWGDSRYSILPTTFDLDGDGTITAEEFDVAVDEVIAEFDSDGNGEFSDDERKLLSIAIKESRKTVNSRNRR